MEGYTSSGSDHYMTSMKGKQHNGPSRVTALTSTLKATNKNLHSVDEMLENYKDLGEQQASAMDKLRDDLLKTSVRLKEERHRQSQGGGRRTSYQTDGRDKQGRRYPTSPLKDYDLDRAASDYDDRDTFSPSRRKNPRGGNVRFYDDMDTSNANHEMHQSMRDVTSGQLRLEDDLNREITRRNRYEFDSTRAMQSVADVLQRSSVDQRLETIHSELQNERKLLQKNQDQVGHISTQLQQALTDSKSNITRDEELLLRNQLAKTSTEKTHVLTELEKAKRKISQVDANTSTLLGQVDEMRRQLLRSEEEKHRLKEQMERQEQSRKEKVNKLPYEEKERELRDRERLRLEDEVKDLRLQLTKSASVLGDFGDLRKELDRSERQRQQLSDHIQVLQKEVESSERQGAKVIKALQEMSENYNRAESQRQQLDAQVQDSQRRLKEYTRERDGLSGDLKESQSELHESQRKREEMKYRAQETVRQWKAKCKRLEKELGATQLAGQQSGTRVEQLSKELDNTRSQGQHSAHQLEVIKREFNQIIAIRAQQEEEVRVKDIQVNELKSFKSDLEKDCRDSKVVIERLEHELHMVREKGAGLYEEKLKIEDQLNGMQQGHLAAQSQIHQLQKEVKELSLVRVELSAQLAEAANHRQELKAALKECRKNEAAAKEEVDSLVKRVKEDKHHSKHKLGTMSQELKNYRSGEVQAVQSVNHQRKKELVEYQADLQALKVELEDSRTNSRRLKKQNEKLKNEIDRVNVDLAKSQEDVTTLQHRYQMVREEYISRSQMSEDGMSRAKELELELIDAKEGARRTEKDHTNILHTIAAELDGVVEVAAMDSIETYKALTLTKNPAEPNGILAEVKSKLSWLKQELRDFRDKENRMKSNIKDVVMNSEKDRQQLVAELERQSEVLEQLAFHRPGTTDKDLNLHDLSSSSLQMEDLKVDKGGLKKTGQEVSNQQQETIHNDSILQKTQEERERIHERYSKLQETMNALRQELFDQKIQSDYNQVSILGSPDGKHQKRVRISTPPSRHYSPTRDTRSPAARSPSRSPALPRRSHSPIARSPGQHSSPRHRTNGVPLALSDEEFQQQFLPKSPPRFAVHENRFM